MKHARLAALFAVTVLLAGCGGGGSGGKDNGVADKSADEIVAASTAAAKNATSVHVQGGTTAGSSPIQLDVHLVAGKGGAGTLEFNGMNFQIIRIGNDAYFKADDATWTKLQGAALAQLINGRWLKAPSTTGSFASFASFTDLAQFAESLLSNHGKQLEKGDTTTIDGTPAIAVNDTTENATLYVATEGEPFPLKVEKNGGDAGTITFSDWNKSYDLKAPDGAVDLSSLGG